MTLRDTDAALTVRRQGNRSPGGSGAAAPLGVDGAFFDGTNDLMLRGAGLTGASDSPLGILSFWVRMNGGDGVTQIFLRNAVQHFVLGRISSNIWSYTLQDSSGALVFTRTSTGTYVAGPTWRHLLIAYDTTLGAGLKTGRLFVNDVADEAAATDATAGFSVDNTDTNWAIGANVAGTSKINADLAEVWWAPGSYLDLTVTANRRKFITAAGKPADLGPDGSAPLLGVPPLSYHHLADGEAVANFALNRGTGGNYAITGTLVTSATSPSD